MRLKYGSLIHWSIGWLIIMNTDSIHFISVVSYTSFLFFQKFFYHFFVLSVLFANSDIWEEYYLVSILNILKLQLRSIPTYNLFCITFVCNILYRVICLKPYPNRGHSILYLNQWMRCNSVPVLKLPPGKLLRQSVRQL